MKAKIGIISHYNKLEKKIKHLEAVLDCTLVFAVGVMEYAIETAVKMEEQLGVDAIVANTVTAIVIEKHVSVPVIPFHVKSINLIDAFYRARKLGSRIAFVDIKRNNVLYDCDSIREMFNYDISCYQFNQLREVNEVADQIIADNCDVVVTSASCMIAISKRRDLQVVLIEPLEHDMRETINTAIYTAIIRKKERASAEWLNAVVNNIGEGVITVGQGGKVSIINAVVRNSFHIEQKKAIGKSFQELSGQYSIFKKLLDLEEGLNVIRDTEMHLVVNKRDIFSDQLYLGSVIRITKLEELQQMELSSRKKIISTGFVATSTFADIKGESKTIKKTKEYAKKYAQTNATVLICGESGTGKEMFAQSIHNHSDRQNGPFVAINCAALPENLLESELFGYEDGAFTGAKKGGKPGLFEISHGGTLFLDEIGEMPLAVQVKILRVLQEKNVRRIGGGKITPINVRIILATNRDLLEQVRSGAFREDLYYRINVLRLDIPPLRDRKVDIEEIAGDIIARVCPEGAGIHPSQLAKLKRYDWFGNVRELSNFIERASILGSNSENCEMVDMLLDELISTGCCCALTPISVATDSEQLVVPIAPMREIELVIIKQLYARYNGDKKEIERTLDISSSTLWRKFKEIG